MKEKPAGINQDLIKAIATNNLTKLQQILTKMPKEKINQLESLADVTSFLKLIFFNNWRGSNDICMPSEDTLLCLLKYGASNDSSNSLESSGGGNNFGISYGISYLNLALWLRDEEVRYGFNSHKGTCPMPPTTLSNALVPTGMQIAVENKDMDAIKILLKLDSSITFTEILNYLLTRPNLDKSFLLQIVKQCNTQDIVRSKEGLAPISSALFNQDKEIPSILLEYSEKTKVSWQDISTIIKLMTQNQYPLVKHLLKQVEDINMVNDIGNTPLESLLSFGYYKMALYLLKNFKPAVETKNMTSLLHGCRDIKVLKELIAQGVEVTKIHAISWLQLFTERTELEKVIKIIANNAKIKIDDLLCYHVVTYNKQQNDLNIIKLLVEKLGGIQKIDYQQYCAVDIELIKSIMANDSEAQEDSNNVVTSTTTSNDEVTINLSGNTYTDNSEEG